MIEQATVERWLTEAGLQYEPVDQVEGAEPPVLWALVFESAFKVLVVQRAAGDWNHLYLQLALEISDKHREALEAVDPDTRDRFVLDLKIALANQPVGHNLEFREEEPGIIDKVYLAINLFEENIEKAGFLRRAHQVTSAGLLVTYMLDKLARFERW